MLVILMRVRFINIIDYNFCFHINTSTFFERVFRQTKPSALRLFYYIIKKMSV